MLTSTNAEYGGKRLHLVDGQQRFTVMTDYETKWDKGKIREHGKKMCALLADEIKFASEGQ